MTEISLERLEKLIDAGLTKQEIFALLGAPVSSGTNAAPSQGTDFSAETSGKPAPQGGHAMTTNANDANALCVCGHKASNLHGLRIHVTKGNKAGGNVNVGTDFSAESSPKKAEAAPVGEIKLLPLESLEGVRGFGATPQMKERGSKVPLFRAKSGRYFVVAKKDGKEYLSGGPQGEGYESPIMAARQVKWLRSRAGLEVPYLPA